MQENNEVLVYIPRIEDGASAMLEGRELARRRGVQLKAIHVQPRRMLQDAKLHQVLEEVHITSRQFDGEITVCFHNDAAQAIEQWLSARKAGSTLICPVPRDRRERRMLRTLRAAFPALEVLLADGERILQGFPMMDQWARIEAAHVL